jgi:hypothetical protein
MDNKSTDNKDYWGWNKKQSHRKKDTKTRAGGNGAVIVDPPILAILHEFCRTKMAIMDKK